ncbi:hypothetical protein QE197_13485 [Arsenophonus nasoniae]|uniref:ExcE-like n=1 Tax=Arsenophonus nasoniae TaxID=638 RepID=D2TXQ1_9GAMM|nr:hypothetical protein [Arsenophonus nasoniae]QBY44502.1 hypothetical protein ArsFIN_30880 [Arsenophonus nasoniae]WGL96708.1 hypothetical protein QE207_09340 [Arsenophonus nasoniae]WGM00735.1 hypothetical protein QE210_12845 [Arsenophonus nasoniae]WGM04762.1 hypothetical protein QE258_14315 [Arsenophonus nasoniae]WGM09862.1 hypothetical protein QE197_13485 [Arsenophonus nasoniae]
MLIKPVTLKNASYSESVISSQPFNGRSVSVDRQVNQSRGQLSALMLDLTIQQQQHLARLQQGDHPSLATRHIEVL